MKAKGLILAGIAAAFLWAFTSLAASPSDLSAAQIDEIWKEVWKSDDSKAPNVEKLSEEYVRQHMLGKWTAMFGVTPDKMTIALAADKSVELSGEKDGQAWKNRGQWRVVADKLVLFLEKDSLPGFIFRSRQKTYVFDPWAKKRMTLMNQEK